LKVLLDPKPQLEAKAKVKVFFITTIRSTSSTFRFYLATKNSQDEIGPSQQQK